MAIFAMMGFVFYYCAMQFVINDLDRPMTYWTNSNTYENEPAKHFWAIGLSRLKNFNAANPAVVATDPYWDSSQDVVVKYGIFKAELSTNNNGVSQTPVTINMRKCNSADLQKLYLDGDDGPAIQDHWEANQFFCPDAEHELYNQWDNLNARFISVTFSDCETGCTGG